MNLDDVSVGTVYSPYNLSDFQKCPRLYDYKKRWDVKGKELNTAILIGAAVAAGLEAHYQGQGRDPKQVAADYVDASYKVGSDRSLEGVQALTRKGVRYGMATNLGLPKIEAVEKFFGRIRPDLVGRDPAGKLMVVDHKVKVNLDDRYKEKELGAYDTSNQMFHYAWAVGQDFGEKVEQVAIHLIVLGPRAYTEMHLIQIDQRHLATWLESAALDWDDMHANERRQRFESCMGKYGPCEFHAACHSYYGDESKFSALYIRRR